MIKTPHFLSIVTTSKLQPLDNMCVQTSTLYGECTGHTTKILWFKVRNEIHTLIFSRPFSFNGSLSSIQFVLKTQRKDISDVFTCLRFMWWRMCGLWISRVVILVSSILSYNDEQDTITWHFDGRSKNESCLVLLIHFKSQIVFGTCKLLY